MGDLLDKLKDIHSSLENVVRQKSIQQMYDTPKNKRMNLLRLKMDKEELEKIRDNIYIYVLVDTLKYLVKNGRLSATSGFVGTLLKIKPLLHIQKDGSLVPYEKIRTTNKAQARLIEIIHNDIEGKNVIAQTHSSIT